MTKYLFLFSSGESISRTAMDLAHVLSGRSTAYRYTTAAVQTPAQKLPEPVDPDIDRVFTLPNWPFSETEGVHLPAEEDHPDFRALSQYIQSGFDHVFLFGWPLAPLISVLPGNVSATLVINEWNIHNEFLLAPDLKTAPTGPKPHEAGELTDGFERVICLEPEVFNTARTLLGDLALALPVPIRGWPADLADTWPIGFRAPPGFSPQTHEGLIHFKARQNALGQMGLPRSTLELTQVYNYLDDREAAGESAVFHAATSEPAVFLNVAIQLHQQEYLMRASLRVGGMLFLWDPRPANSPEPDTFLSCTGQRITIAKATSDQAAWKAFWSASVTEFRAIQDHNLDCWNDLLLGSATKHGRFLFDHVTAIPHGGEVSMLRAHSLAPLDSGPALLLVQALLERGQPGLAIRYLRLVAQVAALTGRRVTFPAKLLKTLKRQSVFAQRRDRKALKTIWVDLNSVGFEETDTISELEPVVATSQEKPRAVSRNMPMFELGLQDNGAGMWQFSDAFSVVFSRKAVANDSRVFILINGRFQDPHVDIASLNVQVDGEDVGAKLTRRRNGTFVLPVEARLAPAADDSEGMFSVTVTFVADGQTAVSGVVSRFDMYRRSELLGDAGLDRDARVLAMMPTHDNWQVDGAHLIERSDLAAPIRWLKTKASPELIWLNDTLPRQRGHLCLVIVLQASRNGAPPDLLYLQARDQRFTANAVPAADGPDRVYAFDISALFLNSDTLPDFEIISPIEAGPIGEDERMLAILLKSMLLVELRHSYLQNSARADGEKVTLHLNADTPKTGTQLSAPNLVSPLRLLELRGQSNESIYGLRVRLDAMPVDVVDIARDGLDFIWRGRPTQLNPVLSLRPRLGFSLPDNGPEAVLAKGTIQIGSIAFKAPETGSHGYELLDGTGNQTVAFQYQSGPFMRGIWAGRGHKLLLDLPKGADAIWLEGDAAIDRDTLNSMQLHCDGVGLKCNATLAPDGRWRVEGQLPEISQGRVSIVEMNTDSPLGRLVALIRRAGFSISEGAGG